MTYSKMVVPLQKLDALNVHTVMEAVENCLNSQESLTINTSFNLNIESLRFQKVQVAATMVLLVMGS